MRKYIRRASGMPSLRHFETAWLDILSSAATVALPPNRSMIWESLCLMPNIVTIVALQTQHSYLNICNDSYMANALAEKFMEIRKAAGDTPATAAGKIGISRQGYVKWENGDTKNMTLNNLLIFCEKYNVAVEPLVSGFFSS